MTSKTLESGDLTKIIIGAVVAAESSNGGAGIGAKELAGKLVDWGIDTDPKRTSMILGNLARQGRIDRVGRGRYVGV